MFIRCSSKSQRQKTFDSNVKRKHFISKMDINNIQMKVKDFGIKWHEDDATYVSVKIQELKEGPFDPILIYKPQGMKEP